jgi:hypothetical protein
MEASVFASQLKHISFHMKKNVFFEIPADTDHHTRLNVDRNDNDHDNASLLWTALLAWGRKLGETS